MHRLVFDIETDDLKATKLWCIVAQDADSGKIYKFAPHELESGLELLKSADVLIACLGSPRFITAEMVKEGAVVIDVGMNRVDDSSKKRGYSLCGDVDFENVKDKCSLITPVPGGVGPMTIAMLLKNTLDCYQKES